MPPEDTQFKPGHPNANPGGRPKSFAKTIKELCGEEKIVEALMTTAWGTPEQLRKFFGVVVKLKHADRLMAVRELADRGWGRPVQTLDHRGDVPGTVRVIHEEADISDVDDLP